MTWNWLQADWSEFRWQSARLQAAEARFLVDAGVILGTISPLDEASRSGLLVEMLSDEALATSRIEGEELDRASVQSSVQRALGLADAAQGAPLAERGIAELTVDLFTHWAEPLTEERLFRWHALLFSDRRGIEIVGGYREKSEPMQVVSARGGRTRVHFEAPPSGRIQDEMRRFFDWLHRTGPSGSAPLPALTRAGIAHLYFESIHPFEDGNGRIGRAIADLVLIQGIGRPAVTPLSSTILLRKKEYYAQLEQSSQTNEVTAWLTWFAGVVLESLAQAQARANFVWDRSRLLEALRGQINERQEKVLLRVLAEGLRGFEGGLSAGKYLSITETSPATARRDLNELVALGALQRTGERRHARYHLNLPRHEASRVTIDQDGRIVDQARKHDQETRAVGGGKTLRTAASPRLAASAHAHSAQRSFEMDLHPRTSSEQRAGP